MTRYFKIASLITLFLLGGRNAAAMSIIDCYTDSNSNSRCITIPILLEGNAFTWQHHQPSPPDLIDSDLYVDIEAKRDPVNNVLHISYNVPFVVGKEISKTFPDGSVAWMKLNQDTLHFKKAVEIKDSCILTEEGGRMVKLMIDETEEDAELPYC